jgi:hypothetical protein
MDSCRHRPPRPRPRRPRKAPVSAFNYSELPHDPSEASAQALGNDLFSVQLFTSATRVGLNDARFIQLRKTYAITERFLAKERLYTYSIGSAKTPQALFDAYGVAKRQGFIAARSDADAQGKTAGHGTGGRHGPL